MKNTLKQEFDIQVHRLAHLTQTQLRKEPVFLKAPVEIPNELAFVNQSVPSLNGFVSDEEGIYSVNIKGKNSNAVKVFLTVAQHNVYVASSLEEAIRDVSNLRSTLTRNERPQITSPAQHSASARFELAKFATQKLTLEAS